MNTAMCSSPMMPVMVNLVLMHGNLHYIILVDVLQMLMCFSDWSNVSVRHEM
jgi:hypothetical protein